MKRLMLAAVMILALPLAAGAQTSSSAGTDWMRVQALSPGTRIALTANGVRARCKVRSVTADSIGCGASAVFARAAVERIRLPRRGLSLGVGLAAGITAGGIAGLEIGGSCLKAGCIVAAVVVAAVVIVVTPVVSFVADPLAKTVYSRP